MHKLLCISIMITNLLRPKQVTTLIFIWFFWAVFAEDIDTAGCNVLQGESGHITWEYITEKGDFHVLICNRAVDKIFCDKSKLQFNRPYCVASNIIGLSLLVSLTHSHFQNNLVNRSLTPFTPKNCGQIAEVEPPKLDSVLESILLNNQLKEDNSNRKKKSVSNHPVVLQRKKHLFKRPHKQHRARYRKHEAFSNREIRLARRFFNKVKKLNKLHKNQALKRRKKPKHSSPNKQFVKKYQNIERWVKRKKNKLRRKSQKQASLNPGIDQVQNVPKRQPRYAQLKNCELKEALCLNLTGDRSTPKKQFLFNESHCDLKRTYNYFITLYNISFMSNVTVKIQVFNTSQVNKTKAHMKVENSGNTSNNKHSISHNPQISAILIVISICISLLTIFAVVFCLHFLRSRQKRHREQDFSRHADLENICQYCEQDSTMGSSSANCHAANAPSSRSGELTAFIPEKKITRDKVECSCCEFKRSSKRDSNKKLCERHKNLTKQTRKENNCDLCRRERNGLVAANSRLLPPVIREGEHNIDSGCEGSMQSFSPYNRICSRVSGNIETPTSSSSMRRTSPHSYQFPDGEERFNSPLAKLVKENLNTPDYFNLNVTRAPPNKTITEAHLGNIEGYSMSQHNLQCKTNNNDNRFSQKSNEHMKTLFPQSVKETKNGEQSSRHYDLSPNARPSNVILTNTDRSVGDSPPLYSDVIREGQIDTRSPTPSSGCK